MTPAEQAAVRNILAELRLTRERVRHLEDRIGDLIDTHHRQLTAKDAVINDLRRRLALQKRQTRKARDLLHDHTKRTNVPKPMLNDTKPIVKQEEQEKQNVRANDARMSA